MKRRLYFLFPDTTHTRSVVDELQARGIRLRNMHTHAYPGIDLTDLPLATPRQHNDAGARVETLLWDGNLVLFFAAVAVLVGLIFLEVAWYWLLLPAAAMLGTFLLGTIFTNRIPNVHQAEFADALRHGEILLMVDVAPWRVAEIESLVHRHPEAVNGGVGWHIDAFGV